MHRSHGLQTQVLQETSQEEPIASEDGGLRLDLAGRLEDQCQEQAGSEGNRSQIEGHHHHHAREQEDKAGKEHKESPQEVQ